MGASNISRKYLQWVELPTSNFLEVLSLRLWITRLHSIQRAIFHHSPHPSKTSHSFAAVKGLSLFFPVVEGRPMMISGIEKVYCFSQASLRWSFRIHTSISLNDVKLHKSRPTSIFTRYFVSHWWSLGCDIYWNSSEFMLNTIIDEHIQSEDLFAITYFGCIVQWNVVINTPQKVVRRAPDLSPCICTKGEDLKCKQPSFRFVKWYPQQPVLSDGGVEVEGF